MWRTCTESGHHAKCRPSIPLWFRGGEFIYGGGGDTKPISISWVPIHTVGERIVRTNAWLTLSLDSKRSHGIWVSLACMASNVQTSVALRTAYILRLPLFAFALITRRLFSLSLLISPFCLFDRSRFRLLFSSSRALFFRVAEDSDGSFHAREPLTTIRGEG